MTKGAKQTAKPHDFTVTYELAPTAIDAARFLNACRAKHHETQIKGEQEAAKAKAA
jgi:hypothetical protein